MSALVARCLFCAFYAFFALVYSIDLSNKDLPLVDKTETNIPTKQDVWRDKSTTVNSEIKQMDAILKLEGRLLTLEKKVRDQEDTIAELKNYKSRYLILEKTVQNLHSNLKHIYSNNQTPSHNLKVHNKDDIDKVQLDQKIGNSSFLEDQPNINTIDSQEEHIMVNKRLLQTSPTNINQIVAFHALMSSNTPDITAEHTLRFDMVKTNIGNGYHPATGVFIVPVTGVYVFTWTIREDVHNYHSTQLMKNTEAVDVVHLSPNGGIGEVTGIAVFMANEGDDVFIETYTQFNAGYISSYPAGRSSFSGWKLA